jgi:hypothetical protein
MFLSPTMGIYQSVKIKKKRIKQVTTKRPIKIRFWGLTSKGTSPKNPNVKFQNPKFKSTTKKFQMSKLTKGLKIELTQTSENLPSPLFTKEG